MELGNLERIEDLRLIWKNEAYDFKPWLAEEDFSMWKDKNGRILPSLLVG